MRICLFPILLALSGCQLVVDFDRSKIDGGAKSLALEAERLDGGLEPESDETADTDASVR